MIKIKVYNPDYYNIWNNFNDNSKNGLFLFNRDFMEYHSHLFQDHSLMFFNQKRLVALLPAHIVKDRLYSHNSLTFGGMITNRKMHANLMLDIFTSLREYLSHLGINKLYYKTIPYIYHIHPSQEDLYALFRNKARLIGRDLSATVNQDEKISFNRNRRRNLKRNSNRSFEVRKSHKFGEIIELVNKNLEEKYKTKATHSPHEMELLARRFPENIKSFVVEKNGEILSGVIIFESRNVAHVQYQASSREGMEYRTIDLIFDYLINHFYQDKKYFDFGISTEKKGQYLNQGLSFYKESFGARSLVHDFYEMDIPKL